MTKAGRTVVLEGNLSLTREGGKVTGIRAILRDVTDREALEEELRRREKLESVGMLAGGIRVSARNVTVGPQDNPSLHRGRFCGVITKPYRLSELAAALQAALEAPRGAR
jgi:hypothetical protein